MVHMQLWRGMAGRSAAVVVTLVVVLLGSAPLAACPWHKSLVWTGLWGPPISALPLGGMISGLEPSIWTEGAPGTATSIEVEASAGEVGQWQAPEPWPVIAIHAALLPTGKVLHYSYPNGGPGSAAFTWDPRTGLFEDLSMGTDIFCSGLSFLHDGRLLVTGGNDYDCTFQGRDVSHTLDPRTGVWTRQDDMSVGRWYPNNVAMGDGSTLIMSGLDRTCSLTSVMERFTPSGGIELVPEGNRFLQLYPRLHLLSTGHVAHVGPEDVTQRFEPGTGWLATASTNIGFRWDGSSVQIPGSPDEVMSCGGSSGAVTNTCERIDFSEPTPTWRFTDSMTFSRSHGDLLILPDRKILMIGGGTVDLYGNPVLNAELYDPDTETWMLLPPQVHGRMYHSTTVLLPDGRVLTAGQDNGASAFTAEIYEPPYLFRGPRPRLASVPRRINYGADFSVGSPDAASIAEVALIGLTTTTHSVNNSQRYVGLSFVPGAAGELTVTAPSNPNAAPPGHYMLFIVNGDGVPGRARIVRLRP